MSYDVEQCTEQCFAMPECAHCHRPKPPRGRDVPAAAAGSYCEHECPGHDEEPLAGHLWPSERPVALPAPEEREGPQ